MKDLSIGFWVLVLIGLVILGPFLTLWALNTLFPVLAIPYGFDTWVATLILHGLFRTSITSKK